MKWNEIKGIRGESALTIKIIVEIFEIAAIQLQLHKAQTRGVLFIKCGLNRI